MLTEYCIYAMDLEYLDLLEGMRLKLAKSQNADLMAFT